MKDRGPQVTAVLPAKNLVKPGQNLAKPGQSWVKLGKSLVRPCQHLVKPNQSLVKPCLHKDALLGRLALYPVLRLSANATQGRHAQVSAGGIAQVSADACSFFLRH